MYSTGDNFQSQMKMKNADEGQQQTGSVKRHHAAADMSDGDAVVVATSPAGKKTR